MQTASVLTLILCSSKFSFTRFRSFSQTFEIGNFLCLSFGCGVFRIGSLINSLYGISSSSSSSGTASVTLQHTHYWVVEFHPRTAAITSLDSVPLYVSLLLCFPCPHFQTVVILGGFTLPLHSTLLHLTHSLHLTPL